MIEADQSHHLRSSHARPSCPGNRAPRFALLAALAMTLLLGGCSSEPLEIRRWNILAPAELKVAPEASSALSPDGQRFAFVARGADGVSRIWIQAVGSLEATSVEGTEDGIQPFWSPDGTSLAFFARERLWTVAVDGGSPAELAEALIPHGGVWGIDDTILFAPAFGDPIHRVPASGGPAVPVSVLDATRKEQIHMHPQWLPDGRTFLYLALGDDRDDSADGLSIWKASLDSAVPQWIVAAEAAPRYAASGQLLFVRDGSLVAESLDMVSDQLAGDATVVARQVSPGFRYDTPVSVSGNGRLLYRPSGLAKESVLTWVGREGSRQGTVGDERNYGTAMLSPDGRRIATTIRDPLSDRSDIWIIDLDRGTSRRLTFAARDHFSPVWSSDSRRIYYYSDFPTGSGTYVATIDSSADAKLVHRGDGFQLLWSISPDDRTGWLLVNNFGAGTRWDIAKLDLETGDVDIFLDSPDRESGPEVSPDGRHLAFHSDRSGRTEIWIVAADDPTRLHQVSRNGGSNARWARDGTEVFFRAPDGFLMAAAVTTNPDFGSGEPVGLFDARERDGLSNRYSVTPNGERFLLNRPASNDANPWILVENWSTDLQD